MTSETKEYRVSRLGGRYYKFTQVGNPENGFLLLVTAIKDGRGNNYQVTLTSFKDDEVEAKYFVLYKEHYSMKFYARSAKDRQDIIESLISALLQDDLENPIQVAIAAGGDVLNEVVVMPPPPISTFH